MCFSVLFLCFFCAYVHVCVHACVGACVLACACAYAHACVCILPSGRESIFSPKFQLMHTHSSNIEPQGQGQKISHCTWESLYFKRFVSYKQNAKKVLPIDPDSFEKQKWEISTFFLTCLIKHMIHKLQVINKRPI